MIFNSIYNPPKNTSGVTTGVKGTSKIDLTSTSFAQLFADATNYSDTKVYNKGDLAYDQNAIWVFIYNNTTVPFTTGVRPPTLPTISSTYWELVGSQGTFTWIAYANSIDGTTDFTTGAFDTGGKIRSYIGIAPNQTSSTESTDPTKYTWSKFRESAPILIGLSRPTVGIPTDSDGLNQVYLTSGDTRLSVAEGNTTLTYDGVGTSNSTWKITSAISSTVSLTGVSITGTAGQFNCTAASVTLAIGTPITISGTFGGTGSITGYTNPKTYYIIATNGSTTFTLSATLGGTAITTTAGTPTGLTYLISTIVPGTASIGGGGTYATYTAVSTMIADTAFIEYTVQGTNSSGIAFTDLKITQTFSKVKGAVLDTIAPSPPTTLTYNNSTSILPGGNVQVKLKANWVAPTTNSNSTPLTDLAYYEVSIKPSANADSTYISSQTTSTSFEWVVDAGTAYTVRVRAVDKSGNFSTYLTGASQTSGTVSTIPNPPTSVTAVATFKNVFLSWVNISDSDLASVEIWRNTTNNSATATRISTVAAAPSATGSFADSNNLVNGTLYYYWLKSVNTSGNVSSSFSPLITSTLSTVVIAGTTGQFTCANTTSLSTVTTTGIAGQFSCASTTLAVGQLITISGTSALISGQTGTKTYVISATNGTTTFTLVNQNGTAIVTTVGTPTGLTYTRNTLAIGQVVIISGTFGGTGSITGYTDPKTYVISATNGTTSFTLVNTDGTPLSTGTGTPTGLTFTRHESARVPAAVGAADIIVGSITADRIRSGELTADLIAVPTSGGLNANIVVSGTTTTIGAVTTSANDPAAKINSLTTTINPGNILINGSTTLADWRTGTNNTEINGGSIAANTISANKLTIGLRGIDTNGITFEAQRNSSNVPTNVVTWTAGNVLFTTDTGISISRAVDAGSATWQGGNLYLYWVKPPTTVTSLSNSGSTITLNFADQGYVPFNVGEFINVYGITATANAPNGTFAVASCTSTSLTYVATATPTGMSGTAGLNSQINSTTSRATASRDNAIILAIFVGLASPTATSITNLTTNIGKTTIDGANITTGSVNANVLSADSGILNRLYLGNPSVPRFTLNGNTYGGGEGLITISDASLTPLVKMGYLTSSTVGFELKNSNNELLLGSSTPLSTIDNGQSGINIANPAYSEFKQTVLPTIATTSSSGTFSVSLDPYVSGFPILNVGSIKLTTGTTSACYVVLGAGLTSYNIALKPSTTYMYSAYVKASVASSSAQLRIRLDDAGSDAIGSFTTSATANTWTRVSFTFTTNATTTSAVTRLGSPTSSNNLWFSGIMIEEAKGSAVSAPSPYAPPALMGQITSSNTGTYIASLNADVITAGTINTDRLTIDGISLSKDPGTGSLRVKALGIDTGFIANNAVTVPVFGYTNGGGLISSWTTLQSLTITTSGSPVKIDLAFLASGATSTSFRVTRSGTDVIPISTLSGGNLIAFTLGDSPSAGTYTYVLSAQAAGPAPVVLLSSLFLQEIKK